MVQLSLESLHKESKGWIDGRQASDDANERCFLSTSALMPAEWQQIMIEWNNTTTDYPKEQCIHQFFEEQVERTPNGVALVITRPGLADQPFTYRELNDRANQLAHYLQTQGVCAETVVAICLERSLELVVGLLGIFKAGGVYLPLYPHYPAERLAFMLTDAMPALILTEREWAAKLSIPTDRVRYMAETVTTLAAQPTYNLPNIVQPHDLAYIIYTSGSTGRPKGVLVEHGGLSNVVYEQMRLLALQPGDRMLQFVSPNFDVSIAEIAMTLCAGATLVLATNEQLQVGKPLAQTLHEQAITHAELPPAVLAAIDPATVSNLHTLLTGGEAFPATLVERWSQVQRFFNAYGPTETTVCSTIMDCSSYRNGHQSPPIGRPLANVQVYVLNEERQPVPIDVAGELYIGGRGVARGYLNQPELTKEKFIANPFGAGRLYRTGDLVRWLPDGNLQFIGRTDQQVKLRGLRIELGEIEAVLSTHPAISAAAVIVREDETGQQQLVAYIVNNPGQHTMGADGGDVAGLTNELRTFLATKLPEAMIPSIFVALATMPVTPNGKIDRQALPKPPSVLSAANASGEAPRTPTEAMIVRVWRTALGVETIGIHDDFFGVGGNSITAMLVVNQLQEEIKQMLHPAAIFQAPTVAQLAAYLHENYAVPAAPVSHVRSNNVRLDQQQVTMAQSAALRDFLRTNLAGAFPRSATSEPKNKPALFVLSPPRSGSTLLRVILAGHPQLFAPPELFLLSFATLGEQSAHWGRNHQSLGEGLLRAVMESKGWRVEQAQALLQTLEAQNLTTKQMYALLQEWAAPKTLVDKSTSYGFNPAVLRQAELDFTAPRYIHLLRHPYGTIRSIVEMRFDQLLVSQSRQKLPVTDPTAVGELLWRISHENIRAFLATVPTERQYRLQFEDLVKAPEATIADLCRFLDIEITPAMLQPYHEKERRMTDGIHKVSRMIGDPKFHQYNRIEATVADRWQQEGLTAPLAEETWQLAEALGYPRPEQEKLSATPQHVHSADRMAALVSSPNVPTTIPTVPRDQPLPASYMQERLWAVAQSEGDAEMVTAIVLRLRGRLHQAALEQSWQELVRRHESFRTAFTIVDGQLMQIFPPISFKLRFVDLSAADAVTQADQVQQLIAENERTPFNPRVAPLFRVTLLRLQDEEHLLLFAIHHILTDAWSNTVLSRELGLLYNAFVRGEPSPLPDLPFQYADYAVWQRNRLQGKFLEEHLNYWRTQLHNAPRLALPTDYPRQEQQPFLPGVQVARLPATLLVALERLSKSCEATLFVSMLAAFQILLMRYSQQEDIVVGTQHANRIFPGLESLIGWFVNAQALRTDLRGNPTFRQAVKRVRRMVFDAYQYQETPIRKVEEALHQDGEMYAFYRTFFMMVNAARPSFDFAALQVRIEEKGEVSVPGFDLSLRIAPGEQGLFCVWGYNRTLFAETTIQRLVQRFQGLLESSVNDPDQPIQQLPW